VQGARGRDRSHTARKWVGDRKQRNARVLIWFAKRRHCVIYFLPPEVNCDAQNVPNTLVANPAGGAHDSPYPLVGWGGDTLAGQGDTLPFLTPLDVRRHVVPSALSPLTSTAYQFLYPPLLSHVLQWKGCSFRRLSPTLTSGR